MPNKGLPVSSSFWITGTAYSPVAAGSPGPFDRNTPSGLRARTSSAEAVAGTTVTLQPERGGAALQGVEIEVAGRIVGDDGVRHAALADQGGEGARVDAGDADDAARF